MHTHDNRAAIIKWSTHIDPERMEVFAINFAARGSNCGIRFAKQAEGIAISARDHVLHPSAWERSIILAFLAFLMCAPRAFGDFTLLGCERKIYAHADMTQGALIKDETNESASSELGTFAGKVEARAILPASSISRSGEISSTVTLYESQISGKSRGIRVVAGGEVGFTEDLEPRGNLRYYHRSESYITMYIRADVLTRFRFSLFFGTNANVSIERGRYNGPGSFTFYSTLTSVSSPSTVTGTFDPAYDYKVQMSAISDGGFAWSGDVRLQTNGKRNFSGEFVIETVPATVVKYAPVVVLFPGEKFKPADPLVFLANAALYWRDDVQYWSDRNSLKAAKGKIDAARLGAASIHPYTHFSTKTNTLFQASDYTRPRDDQKKKTGNLPSDDGFFVDLLADSVRTGNPNTSTTPATVYKGAPLFYDYKPGEYITYWFFYAYNDDSEGGHVQDGGTGLGTRFAQHEGDWEHITIRLNGDDTPYSAYFSAHDGGSDPFLWDSVDAAGSRQLLKEDDSGTLALTGTHLVVYSAVGSHASYRDAKTQLRGGFPKPDDETGQGLEWRTWQDVLLDVTTQAWYGFGGAWGEIGETIPTDAGLTTGPLGPSIYKGFAPPEFLPQAAHFEAGSYSVLEGVNSPAILVKRDGDPSGISTVRYSIVNGTASDGDYSGPHSGTHTFAPGETSASLPIQIIDDTIDEADETLTITLSPSPGGLGVTAPNVATVTILDNDLPSSQEIKRPVVLVRGMLNHSDFDYKLKPELQRLGYDVRGPYDISVDGKASIADSAQYVRAILMQQFPGTNAADVDLVAHSAGGLVARYLNRNVANSNRRNDGSQLVRVHNLITLGTPLGGSKGADLTVLRGHSLYGDILKDLQTSRAYVNPNYADVPGTRYWKLGGDNPYDGSNELYPSFLYSLNFLVEKKLYDGLANVLSVLGRLPAEEHNPPNSDRYQIFPDVNHANLLRNANIVSDYVIPALSETYERWSPPYTVAPSAAMRSLSRVATAPESGALQSVIAVQPNLVANGTATVSLSVDSTSKAIFSVSSKSTCNVSLVKPDGTVLPPGITSDPSATYSTQADTDGILSYTWVISNPPVGQWQLKLAAGTLVAGGGSASVQSFVDSSLACDATLTVCDYSNGGSPRLSVTLADSERGIASATVQASITSPGGIVTTAILYDDGVHNDRIANDGIYGAQLGSKSEGGLFRVSFTATGATSSGEVFQRSESSFFMVTPAGASLTFLNGDRGSDSDSDGVFEGLAVDIGIKITTAGTYLVEAELADSGGRLIATSSYTGQALPIGSRTVSLFFDGAAIGQAGISGPFVIQNIRLSLVAGDRPFVIVSDLAGFSTAPYQVGQFAAAPAILRQPLSQTVTVDSIVEVSVDSTGTSPKSYQWRRNGIDLPGETNATMILGSVSFSQSGSYSVRVSNAYGAVVSLPGRLDIRAKTSSEWVSTYFSPQEWSDPNRGGSTGDWDMDGLTNLQERAFGSNPKVANQAEPLTAALQAVGAKNYLVLSYRRLINVTDLTYAVEVSRDLRGWDKSQTQVEQLGTAVANQDGITETVTVRLRDAVEDSGIAFMRVRVEQ